MEKEIRSGGQEGRQWCAELFAENRRVALAARDAEWAAWRAANGVAEKTVETRNDGTTVVTYGRRIVSAPPWAVPGHI